jgi:hypothetical protein
MGHISRGTDFHLRHLSSPLPPFYTVGQEIMTNDAQCLQETLNFNATTTLSSERSITYAPGFELRKDMNISKMKWLSAQPMMIVEYAWYSALLSENKLKY